MFRKKHIYPDTRLTQKDCLGELVNPCSIWSYPAQIKWGKGSKKSKWDDLSFKGRSLLFRNKKETFVLYAEHPELLEQSEKLEMEFKHEPLQKEKEYYTFPSSFKEYKKGEIIIKLKDKIVFEADNSYIGKYSNEKIIDK